MLEKHSVWGRLSWSFWRACDAEEGQVWIANGWSKPEGFCDSAWDSISAFVMPLAHGGENIYDGWMKNP